MITRIEKEATYESRYCIYVDEEPLFSIHQDVLVKFHIHKGMSTDKKLLEQLFEEEEKNRVKQIAYHFISYKHRTIYEVKRYLLQKGENEKYINAIISEMIDRGYLNDQQYARQWVQEKRKTKGWGYFRLKQELKRKGIESKWIDEAIDEDDEAEYKLAMEKARKRYSRFLHEPWRKVENKLGVFLLREGFSHDIIFKTLNSLRLYKES